MIWVDSLCKDEIINTSDRFWRNFTYFWVKNVGQASSWQDFGGDEYINFATWSSVTSKKLVKTLGVLSGGVCVWIENTCKIWMQYLDMFEKSEENYFAKYSYQLEFKERLDCFVM